MENISKKYEKQKKFFNSGTSKSIQYRINSLKKLKKNISLNENEIINALNSDLGKSETETFFSEIALIYIEINLALKNVKRWSKKRKVSSSLINFLSSDYIIPEPYGVTLNISPWNYPFQLSISPLIGAVAAGNTVILKPSEFSSKTSEIIKKIIENTFEKGHVDVILGGPEIGSKLLDFNWDYIFFTGSTNIGKIVAQKAAINLTPTTLELGGKNPCIVDETANLKVASKRIVFGKFLNCGQTCIAPDFILVHESVKKDFTDKIIERIKKIYNEDVENSENYSRIINKKHFSRLIKLLEKDKIIYGGKNNPNSNFIEPTLIDGSNFNSSLMKEEIFGPILPVVSYSNKNELKKILDNYKDPLAFYIFSNDKKFSNELIKRYSFGGAAVNDTISQIVNHRLPFGGIRNSGSGSYHGKQSFKTFSFYKPYIVKSNIFDLNAKYKIDSSSVLYKLLKRVVKKISL
ncbi:MAG: aldehyde dehydrogenase family protein [Flavobacteriaceae bacterium]|nr:aldehyde dehydrogenase family protein [Flavobacteriaceae bacterium]MBL6680731.1 aldehyde dehydrogenase family protein [Flavobacteriaceae bacterium]